MAPVPADRFASAGEFAETLAAGGSGRHTGRYSSGTAIGGRPRIGLAAAAAAAIALVIVFVAVAGRWRGAAHAGSIGVLAVLPFDNFGAGSDEYFAEGLTDELRAKLSAIGGLRVIATGSSEQYRHSPKSQTEIARELGARYLLVGSVRWERLADGKSRVRVSPELVDVTSPAPTTTWKQAFDAADLEDVFTVQANIATDVAAKLGVALGGAVPKVITTRPTENQAAYNAYLQGLALLPRTITAGTTTPSAGVARQAAAAFRQAVSLDPRFADAWARLSLADSRLYLAEPSPAVLAECQAAAERALAIAPTLADGHQAMGAYYATGPGDYARALAEDSIGLAAEPDNVDLLTSAAANEINVGRLDPAIARLRRALALDPRSVLTATRLASALLRRGDFAGARDAADRGLAVDPTSLALLEADATARRAQGDLAGARAVLDRALAVAPDNLELIEQKVITYLMAGDLAGARGVVRAASALVDTRALLAYIGGVYDLYWVLDDADQRTLLSVRPETFTGAGAGNRRDWALALAHTAWLRGDAAKARAYADTALIASGADDGSPSAQDMALRGVAYAYLGKAAEAKAAGRRATAFDPIATDRQNGPYTQLLLARILVLAGEPDSAAAALAVAAGAKGFYLTPAWLAIDPTWKGLPRVPSSLQVPAN